jgi:hypothetical protein
MTKLLMAVALSAAATMVELNFIFVIMFVGSDSMNILCS